jgi:hypothetical protein
MWPPIVRRIGSPLADDRVGSSTLSGNLCSIPCSPGLAVGWPDPEQEPINRPLRVDTQRFAEHPNQRSHQPPQLANAAALRSSSEWRLRSNRSQYDVRAPMSAMTSRSLKGCATRISLRARSGRSMVCVKRNRNGHNAVHGRRRHAGITLFDLKSAHVIRRRCIG